MRRNGGRHAYGDALRAIGKKIGKCRRQHHRFFAGTVVRAAEVYRVFVDAIDQQPRNFRQPRFRVAHSRRVIAVDISKVALPVHQRIALGKVLCEPHQRVVDGLVAVRVEIAHHVADDFGGLLESGPGVEPQLPHAIKNAAMHRLEPIARIGQRAVHDRGKGVGEVAFFERFAQRDLFNLAFLGGISLFPMLDS